MDMFTAGFEQEIYEQQRRMDVRNRAIASLWQEYETVCFLYGARPKWSDAASLFADVEAERAEEEDAKKRKGSMKLPEKEVTL